MDNTEKLIIIGSGPAGLTAAIYAARGGLDPLVITGEELGGLPTIASLVEDYPGFPEGIQGSELSKLFLEQAKKFQARILIERVVSVDFANQPLKITTSKETLLARAVIIATGSSPKWLGLPSEKKLIGRGVSACAVCDGNFFKDKKVAMVGGGDAAVKEAVYLSKIVSEVIILHRRDELRAQEALQKQMRARPNIKLMLNTEVEEILGKEKVTGVKIKNTQNNEESTIECDGVFVAIGYTPSTKFLEGQVELDERGYVKVFDHCQTSVPGVFVAGDVQDSRYRQISVASGSGTQAALDVEEYLSNLS